MKPRRLKSGDTIGVVATSDPITEDCMDEINLSISRMEKLEIKVKFANHAFSNPTGYGETAKHKAEDINNMFADPMIAGIFCAMRWI